MEGRGEGGGCPSLSDVSWELSFVDVIMSSSVCLVYSKMCLFVFQIWETLEIALLLNFSFVQNPSITKDV